MLFTPEFGLRTALREQWQSVATASLREFSYMSLRYRHTKRYKQIVATHSSLPEFRTIWEVAHEDPDSFSHLRVHSYRHECYGELALAATVTSTMTGFGSLYVCTFAPRNTKTDALFGHLSQAYPAAHLLEAWPYLEEEREEELEEELEGE